MDRWLCWRASHRTWDFLDGHYVRFWRMGNRAFVAGPRCCVADVALRRSAHAVCSEIEQAARLIHVNKKLAVPILQDGAETREHRQPVAKRRHIISPARQCWESNGEGTRVRLSRRYRLAHIRRESRGAAKEYSPGRKPREREKEEKRAPQGERNYALSNDSYHAEPRLSATSARRSPALVTTSRNADPRST